MKFYYISDIHLDFWTGRFLSESNIRKESKAYEGQANAYDLAVEKIFKTELISMLPKADKEAVLIIAGDLWIGHKAFSYFTFSWLEIVCDMFKDVVFVSGNHDIWSEAYAGYHTKAKALAKEQGLYNLHILENDCWLELESNTLVVGTMLWTDMDNHSPTAIQCATFMMNDFKHIDDFTTTKWLAANTIAKDYLKHIVEQNSDKKVLIVTHHAPTGQSIGPYYRGHESNPYYHSEMGEFILDNPCIKYWVHGHIHNSVEYDVGVCKVVSNPVGYLGHEINSVDVIGKSDKFIVMGE